MKKKKILLIAIISLIAIIGVLIYNVLNTQVDLNRTELLGTDDTQADSIDSIKAVNSSAVTKVSEGTTMDSDYSFSLRYNSNTTTKVWRLW